jgi:hypothetical protein
MATARRGREIQFTWHIETVSGKEGEAVREAQARAIRELLLWVESERLKKEQSGLPLELEVGTESSENSATGGL